MKQETLENAVKSELEFIHNSCRNFDFDLGFKTGGLIGAKWQQEDILELLKVNGYEDEPIFDLITEQFKKK